MSEIKQKLPKLGIVVAIEVDAVLSKYGSPVETQERHGFKTHLYRNERFEMVVVDSGAGEISATAATQYLISEYSVDMILNFGVVGGLTEAMAATGLCVVDQVIHYEFDTTGWLNLARGQYPGQDSAYISATPSLLEQAMQIEPSLCKVVCASADKFVEKPEDKIALHEKYGADICEMEAAGVVYTCNRAGVPCLLIKAVADSLVGGGKEFFAELTRASDKCFEVADKIANALFTA